MSINTSQPGLASLSAEIQQVLVGAIKAASCDTRAASGLEAMKRLSHQEWREAAKALQTVRDTSILEALSPTCLEAVADGHIDVRSVLHIAITVVEERAAEKSIREIAARRLNMDLDEQVNALHSLETGLLHDALMEAYMQGLSKRPA